MRFLLMRGYSGASHAMWLTLLDKNANPSFRICMEYSIIRRRKAISFAHMVGCSTSSFVNQWEIGKKRMVVMVKSSLVLVIRSWQTTKYINWKSCIYLYAKDSSLQDNCASLMYGHSSTFNDRARIDFFADRTR